jgi:hypothetical protein
MQKLSRPLLFISLACAVQFTGSALAQSTGQNNYQQLEKMLDSVESGSRLPGQVQQSNAGRSQLVPVNQTPVMQQGGASIQQAGSMQPVGSMQQMPGMSGQGTQQFAPQAQPQLQRPGFGKTLRKMFGDPSGYTQGDGSANSNRAQEQASRAHNACQRSYYGDHYSRSQAADEAYYAAEEARHEADAAYAKVQARAPNAQSYADSARAAADSAQAEADTARSNADSNWR